MLIWTECSLWLEMYHGNLYKLGISHWAQWMLYRPKGTRLVINTIYYSIEKFLTLQSRHRYVRYAYPSRLDSMLAH